MSKPKKVIVPLSLPPDLKRQVEKASRESEDLSEQDVMRMAIRRGLPILKTVFQGPRSKRLQAA